MQQARKVKRRQPVKEGAEGRCGRLSAAVRLRFVTVGGAAAAIRARGKGRSIDERVGTGQAAAKQFRLVAGMEIMADLA